MPSRGTAASTTPPSLAASSSTRDRAARRERAGHLSPGAVARTRRCTSAAASCSAAMARCSSRRANGRSPRGACRRSGWTACSARSCASTRRHRFPRTTRSSARTACGRRSGRSAIATFRRRRSHPTTGELWEVEHGTRGGDEINIARKGKDYGWPTIAYGIEYRGGPITGGITAQEGMEQPRLLLGPGHRAERHGVLHGRTCFRPGRAASSSAATRRAISCDSCSKATSVTGEERLLTDLQPKRERIRDVRAGARRCDLRRHRQRDGSGAEVGAEEVTKPRRARRHEGQLIHR